MGKDGQYSYKEKAGIVLSYFPHWRVCVSQPYQPLCTSPPQGVQNTTTIKILYSFHSGYGSPGTIPSNSIVLGVSMKIILLQKYDVTDIY